MSFMSLKRAGVGMTWGLVAVAAMFGCSSTGSSPGDGSVGGGGTGGAAAGSGGSGSGGQTATGGQSATGGRSASGGQSAPGGQSASGGQSATGGQSASGGRPAAGGQSATGGANGGGGGNGTGGRGGAQSATGGASGGGGGNATGGRGGAAVGGAGGNAGSAGAGGTFAPCPAAGSDCVIMPLGDSITDGFGTPGGYRIELFRQALMGSKRITFAGRNANGPNSVMVGTTTTPFPRGHEGYSGYTIDPGGGRSGISPLVDAAITMARPHIILLMIGTNDVDLSLDVANAPTRLAALLDRITADAPNALVVLAKITPLNDDAGNVRVRAYNDAIPALVQSRVAAGKHLLLVDMYTPFTANPSYKTALLADKWHPNPAGYLVMAQTWYPAIERYLP